jgi:glycogen debranching enzyme
MSKARPIPAAGWLPVGEEPQPTGSITDCVILRNDGVSLVALPGGDIDAAAHEATGLYRCDTRHLSRFRLTLGGVAPILLDASQSGAIFSAVYTNPAMADPAGRVVPARALVIRRRRVLGRGLVESLTISNYHRDAQAVEVRLEVDADFHDIFEVRGFERRSARPPVDAQAGRAGIRFRYAGADGAVRTTSVRFDPPPSSIGAGGALYRLVLEPRETVVLDIRVSTGEPGERQPVPQVIARVQREERAFLDEATRFQCDYEPLNDAVERALLDVRALRTGVDGTEFIAAGVPWFDTLFGRDSLITGMFLAPWAPGLLRGALEVLARYQAEEHNAASDAAPGKIPHELRWGELARIGEVPFGRYYGSIDATPLFLVAAEEYLAWTGDRAAIERLWPNLRTAARWCLAELERHGGVVAYARESPAGLENQGWKDSHDAIRWPDGRLVEPPIALVEVQAYTLAALRAFARMAALCGEPADGAEAAADRLAALIEERFGDDALGYVLCLERARTPVPTPASNPGHLLWLGDPLPARAAAFADRAFQSDLFSGWGVRTLASSVAGYNPLGYHTGSVWPHDNAILLAGLRRHGFDDLARALGTAFIEAALAFPAYRIPELYCGDPRELRLVPTPYPVASRPQAWSAASLPFVLATMLGVRPAGPRTLAITRPQLPGMVEWVRLRNLRVAGAGVDLAFRRGAAGVAVEVEGVRGDLAIVLSDRWPQ